MKILPYRKFITEKLFKYETEKYEDPVKNAVWNYVAGYTVVELNKALRNGKKSKELDNMCSLIDSAMKRSNKGILYRVVEWEYLQNIYRIYKENIDDMLFGRFIAKGYTSTTKESQNIWGSSFSKNEVFMEISYDRPVNCIDINKMFKRNEIDCWDQKEMLLQRDLNFTITGYQMLDYKGRPDKKGEIHMLFVRVL